MSGARTGGSTTAEVLRPSSAASSLSGPRRSSAATPLRGSGARSVGGTIPAARIWPLQGGCCGGGGVASRRGWGVGGTRG
jgi:hypothetical protein